MSRLFLSRDAHSQKNVRVLIADDQALVRAGLHVLVQTLGYTVVAEADNGAELLTLVAQLKPDIVLMDPGVSAQTSLEVVARIHTIAAETRVIVLAMQYNGEYARRALQVGASGYILKNERPEELEQAMQLVRKGKLYFSGTEINSETPGQTINRREHAALPFTPRQLGIVRLLVKGYTRKQISKQLEISVKTFDTYRAQIMEALQIHHTSELVEYMNVIGLDTDV